MLVLALDTTSRTGSVALARDGELLGCHSGLADRTHAERLPADLLAHLERQQLALGDVDLFGVAAGPGSFTGLRIGIATIQGLAFACHRPVVAVSALDALASLGSSPEEEEEDALVAAWIDARRHEVFSALYASSRASPDPGKRMNVLDAPSVGAPERTLERWNPIIAGRRVRFIGDGASAYRELLAGTGRPDFDIVDPSPPLAPAIAMIARVMAQSGGAVAPHAVQPIYVRRPDAELARDRLGSEG